MSAADLLHLARIYATATSLSLASVGVRACGNDKIFPRLAAGKGASTTSVEKAALWFAENWPDSISWPDGITRPATAAAA